MQEGQVQIYLSLCETDGTKIMPELQYIIYHACLQLLLYDKYLTEGKFMAVHTMKAHWEWKYGSTHSYNRH